MTSTQNRMDRTMFLPTPSLTIARSSSTRASGSAVSSRYAFGNQA